MALDGFIALAPDFLSPQGGTPADEDKAREMFSGLDMSATVADAEATRVWLSKREGANGKVGAVGFCWGGGLVNRLATKSEGLNAGVAKVFDMIATDRLPFLGYHMPFPAVGYAEKQDVGYRFVPKSYQFDI